MVAAVMAFVGWLILMFIGTNLIGVVMRGIFRPSLDRFNSNPVLASMAARANKTLTVSTIAAVVLGVAYLYALGYFWNLGVVAGAVLLIVSRIPDLVWEIQSGERVTASNGPNGSLAIVSTGLSWAALPVLWFALR